MTLPLVGTVDLSPSGLFLIFAVVVAVGYLTWQILGARRKATRAAGEADSSADSARNSGVSGEAASSD